MRHLPKPAILILSLLLLATPAAGVNAQDAPCAPEAVPATPSPDGAPEALAWEELDEMPRPRSELAAAAVGGTIYVVGGFGGGAMIDCFHTATGTWAIGADLPIGVHHPGVAALGDRVYVAGGYTDAGDATAALWAYDPATDTWEQRADMPTSRGALGLAAVGELVYAVGGARERLGGPVTGAVEAYDPETDSWETQAPLPTPREHVAVAADAERVYVIGGRANGDEGDQFAAAAEAYDPATDTWETLPPLPTPRGGFAGTFASGLVVVFGGERGTITYDDVEAYDPVARTWSTLPPLPTPRHGVAGAAVGDTVYAVAGSTRARAIEHTAANEALTLSPAD